MGSEFAYEDISNNTLDRFSYKLIGVEEYNSKPCYIVERIPTYKNSGYTKIKTWYDKESYIVRRAEYTDRKKSLLKVMTFEGWKQYPNGTWRAEKFRMENLQTHKVSSLIFKDRKMGIGLKVRQFNQRNLQRILQ